MGDINNQNQRHPRLHDQQADLAVGSPLAIVALFTELVRERFRPGNGLAWVWNENPTTEETEENTLDAPRKIQIEPSFNERTETRNFRPGIYIDKGETVAGKVAVGNFTGAYNPAGLRAFYALGTAPMEIDVFSDSKGESATLGDLVWFYMLAGREQIRASFGLHDITPPILGRTTAVDADKTQWTTRISFEIQFDLRWWTMPVSPLIKEIVIRFRDSGETNPDTYLLKQYIR